MGRAKREIFTGVEIGTATVKVVMAELAEDDILLVCGLAEEPLPLRQVVKGEIVEAEAVADHLARACSNAESMAGRSVDHMFLAVTGAHIRNMNNTGRVRVNRQDRRITDDDVVAAHENAKNYPLPIGQQMINHWDRRYVVDATREALNPSGLIGDLVEAEIHVVYGQLNNLMTSSQLVADLMNRPLSGIFFSGIASGYAVCSPSEMQRGRLVIDLGAGVTEYAGFHGPGVFHTGQVTVGCQQIVNDLSLGLDLSYAKCQKILLRLAEYGSAIMSLDSRRVLDIESLGKSMRQIPFSTIETIVELRLRELFEVIVDDLRRQDVLRRLGMGAVVTGGGAEIPAVDRLAQQVLAMPVALGWPRQVESLHSHPVSPRWATPLGLIRLGAFALNIEAYQPSFREMLKADWKNFSGLLTRAFRW